MLMVDMPMPMNCGECRFRADGWCYGIAEFENQPTALNFDARPSWCPIKGELVRCKDCKHYDGKWCLLLDMVNSDMGDWFCAYGERKDGEHDTE